MSHHDLPLRMLVTVAGAIPAASATALAVRGRRPGRAIARVRRTTRSWAAAAGGGASGLSGPVGQLPSTHSLGAGRWFRYGTTERYLSRAALLATSAHLSRQRFGGLVPVLSAAGFVNKIFFARTVRCGTNKKTYVGLG